MHPSLPSPHPAHLPQPDPLNIIPNAENGDFILPLAQAIASEVIPLSNIPHSIVYLENDHFSPSLWQPPWSQTALSRAWVRAPRRRSDSFLSPPASSQPTVDTPSVHSVNRSPLPLCSDPSVAQDQDVAPSHLSYHSSFYFLCFSQTDLLAISQTRHAGSLLWISVLTTFFCLLSLLLCLIFLY